MKAKSFVVTALAAILMAASNGCQKDADQKLEEAMKASQVSFQPNRGETIVLSQPQGDAVKRIAQLFGNRSDVRVEREMLGFKYGDFIMGDQRFSWQGKMLYFRRENGKWHVVEAAILGKLTDAYMKAQGTPPLQAPSLDQWKEILALLTKFGFADERVISGCLVQTV
jgi:hypothetical protein